MDKWGILVSIIVIFIGVGTILPFLNSEFNNYDIQGPDVSTMSGGIETPSGSNPATTAVSTWGILVSVLSMFFWSFGALPLVIEIIFVILRITFLFILIDLLWIG